MRRDLAVSREVPLDGRGEVSDRYQLAFRFDFANDAFEEAFKVDPLKRCALEAAEVQILPINVSDCAHALFLEKKTPAEASVSAPGTDAMLRA